MKGGELNLQRMKSVYIYSVRDVQGGKKSLSVAIVDEFSTISWKYEESIAKLEFEVKICFPLYCTRHEDKTFPKNHRS